MTGHAPQRTLDIVVATYKRPELLRLLLASIRGARRPTTLSVRVVVVDNACIPEVPAVVSEFAVGQWFSVHCIAEPRPGLSAARNAGLNLCDADLIGFLDDDERVGPRWFEVTEKMLGREDIDFISGPYRGDWQLAVPGWYSGAHPGIVGEIGVHWKEHALTLAGPGMLFGGNAVVRRTHLERAGAFDESLGRMPSGFGVGEDDDLFRRLLASGARGRFVPDLWILHHIPAERLSRGYHRQWMRSAGRATAFMDRRSPPAVPMVLGIPRFRLGQLARSALGVARASLAGRATTATWFDLELECQFLGSYVRSAWKGS